MWSINVLHVYITNCFLYLKKLCSFGEELTHCFTFLYKTIMLFNFRKELYDSVVDNILPWLAEYHVIMSEVTCENNFQCESDMFTLQSVIITNT